LVNVNKNWDLIEQI